MRHEAEGWRARSRMTRASPAPGRDAHPEPRPAQAAGRLHQRAGRAAARARARGQGAARSARVLSRQVSRGDRARQHRRMPPDARIISRAIVSNTPACPKKLPMGLMLMWGLSRRASCSACAVGAVLPAHCRASRRPAHAVPCRRRDAAVAPAAAPSRGNIRHERAAGRRWCRPAYPR